MGNSQELILNQQANKCTYSEKICHINKSGVILKFQTFNSNEKISLCIFTIGARWSLNNHDVV